ncbi:hypothetical protein E1287_07395 [Actinomadura sp. KC06]|uniref:hypothetical protein n=1 Tax=Actinomadura sp. KC06 TaxID=2530369 RepID=UPI0010521192|nr:hypothetical protein [Actinomadura sp. KC06]TDD37872.1 hypothetical protein E1287_07395 [Actinomadura sp. KC06]
MDDHEDRQREIGEKVILGYLAMVKVLGMLPIPISLPAKIDEEWTGADAAAAIVRSHDMILDLPLAEETKVLLVWMILDWLTALTFGTLDQSHPAVWRLECADYAILRLQAHAEVVIDHLTSGPDLE